MLSVGTHNTLFTLDAEEVRSDLDATIHIKLRGLQEVSDTSNQKAIERFCKANRFGLIPTYPIPIIYDPVVLAPVGSYTMVQASPAIDPVNDPARWVVVQRFTHLSTGKVVAIVNTHGPKYVFANLDKKIKRREAARQHWLTVLGIVSSLMAEPEIDAVFLTGDMNASSEHTANWFDPANLLSVVVVNHSRLVRLIDWIAVSRGSNVRTGGTRSYKGNSDHKIRWVNYSL